MNNLIYITKDWKGNTLRTTDRIQANNTAYHAQRYVDVYDRESEQMIDSFLPYKILMTPGNDFHCHELKGSRVKTY